MRERRLFGKIVTDPKVLAECESLNDIVNNPWRAQPSEEERLRAYEKLCRHFQVSCAPSMPHRGYNIAFIGHLVQASRFAEIIKEKGLEKGAKVLVGAKKTYAEVIGFHWDYRLRILFLDGRQRVCKTSLASPREVKKVKGPPSPRYLTFRERFQCELMGVTC